jgi:AcrR family transcriptional regulator
VSARDPQQANRALAASPHRRRILKAASELFASRGARQVTVEDILQSAEVARRTFYRFFRSKDDVLAALYEISSHLILTRIQEAWQSSPDIFEGLARGIDAYLTFNRTDGALMRVMEGEALRSDSPLAATRSLLIATLADQIAARVEQAQGQRPDPLLVTGVLVALEGVSHRLHSEGEMDAAAMERARQVMHRILLGTLSTVHGRVPPLPKDPG